MLDFMTILISELDLPATILVFMLLGMALAMAKAQQRDDFDWTEAFRDEAGKITWTRAALLMSLAVSTWVLIYAYVNGMHASYSADDLVKVLHELFWYFATYMAMWAMGPRFVEKLADAIIARWGGRAEWTQAQRDTAAKL